MFNDFKNLHYKSTTHKLGKLKDIFDRLTLPSLEGFIQQNNVLSSKIVEITAGTILPGGPSLPPRGPTDPIPDFPVVMNVSSEDNTISDTMGSYLLIVQLTKQGGEVISDDIHNSFIPSPPLPLPNIYPTFHQIIGNGNAVLGLGAVLTFAGTITGYDPLTSTYIPSTGPFIGTYYLPFWV
jgi:hypothetical protein